MGSLDLGIDARAAMVDPNRGLGRVVKELVGVLLQRPEIRVTVFVPRGTHPSESWYRSATEIVQLPQPRRGAFLWDGSVWRWVLRHHPVNVLHLPAWGVPPGLPVPVVATLHDVTPLRFPGAIPSRRVRHRAVQRLGTYRRATLVHAVSRATARDAVRALGIDPERVRVVHNGVAVPEEEPEDRGQRRHVLYVGGADAHKRVDLLLAVWTAPGAADLPPLVLAGAAAAWPGAVRAAQHHPERVRLAGLVDEEALDRLYQLAVAVVLPSLWEGYGLPVLEGMARGAVPVITSRASLPEVGADAALYVPAAAGPGVWASAIRRLVHDPALRARLARRGRELAVRRSWHVTARNLIELYQEAGIHDRMDDA